ncbi:MAG: hypothetical protein IKP00_17345 [Victivallales bacterium]|nr:hypothetical protein [Victivallales bacterium]
MKGIRLLLVASAMFCLTHSVSAASMMKVKMAETYLKTAEAGGFTAKSAAKEARQRVDALKKEYGEDDPDVQALEKRLLIIEGKEKAAQEEKRAKQQAEQKAEAEKKADVKSLLPVPAVAAAVGFTTPKPWVLDTDYEGWNDKNPIEKYVKTLGQQKREEVLELDKQLRARIKEARAIVQAGGANQAEAEKEIERYEAFLGAVENPVLINCDIKIDAEKKRMDFYSVKIFFSNFSREVRFNKNDGKCYFYGDNGEPEYIRENELPYAQEALACMKWIYVFHSNQGNDDHYMQISSKAAVSCQKIEEALKNNSPNVVIFHPMDQFPKGALHDSLAKEALPLARTVPLLANAEEVIINSNDWEIFRNQLTGIITRRVCRGWTVVTDDIGKRVIPTSWGQENQGGNTYGKLYLNTYGGNAKFYVK